MINSGYNMMARKPMEDTNSKELPENSTTGYNLNKPTWYNYYESPVSNEAEKSLIIRAVISTFVDSFMWIK
jgi:hypothetical protein